MTDNEIKKGLAELLENQEDGYTTCLEYGGKRDLEQEKLLDLLSETLKLIDRLQADYETVKAKLYCYKTWYFEAVESLENAKNEINVDWSDIE